MRPRIPLATVLAGLLAACASPPPPAPPGPECASPRLHHLLDLQDARAPLPELEPFVRDPDPEVRARAALAVAGKALAGGDKGTAETWLRMLLRDPDASVRTSAAFAMGLTDDADLAGDALLAARRVGAAAPERAAAASAAVRLGGKRLWEEPEFAALFTDSDAGVRRAAYRALPAAVRGWKEKPKIDGPFAAGLLRPDEKDPEVVVAAAMLLRSLLTPVPPGGEPDLAEGGAVAGTVLAHLSSPDPDARAACGRFLAAAIGSVTRLKDEGDPRVRASILLGLARQRSEESGATLLAALKGDPDFGVRATAALALGVRAKGGALELAAGSAKDPSRLVRVESLNSLHLVERGGDQVEVKAAFAIESATRSEDPFLRAASAGKLSSLEALARLAKDPEIRVRESAVNAAWERGRVGYAICLAALDDTDPVVAATAASGLGAMGPQEPDPKAKEPPPPPMDATQIADAIAALERVLAAHPAPSAAPDDWADLRAAAFEALWKLKDQKAGDLGRPLLGDPDPSVRDMAAKIIEEIDKKKPEMPLAARLRPFPERAEIHVSGGYFNQFIDLVPLPKPDEWISMGPVGPSPIVRFETDRGTFVVRTIPAAAPVHVARFLARVREGGYDGTVFHRIVPAFVVQGGDPHGDGSGSGGACTREEFSPLPYRRGTLGVPRNSNPDSGGCQLFFCHGETPHLDQRYTIMGEIVEGIEVIDRIDLGDRIIKATVL